MSENTPETTGTANAPAIVDRFRDYLRQRAAEDAQRIGGDQLTEKQVTAILAAQSEDEVWDADNAGLIPAQNLVGSEIEVRSILFGEGQRDDIDPGFLGSTYALCECVAVAIPDEVESVTGLKPGDEFIMDTGVSTIMSKIRWFEANKKLPVRGVIKGIPTGRGRTVLQFKRPPKRAVNGQVASE